MSVNKTKLTKADFDQRVGEIVTFIGLKGLMKVRPCTNNAALFLDLENVLLQMPNKDKDLQMCVKATVKDIKLAKNFLQMQLNEYDSRTAVEDFRGAQIYTPKSELRDLSSNQWWVSDLIGLAVYTKEGKLIGTVCDAPGEQGEFLEIKKADNSPDTVVVSFVKELFPVVDIKARRIEAVDLPGLFD
jgi:16S rRNA processing protein RimM